MSKVTKPPHLSVYWFPNPHPPRRPQHLASLKEAAAGGGASLMLVRSWNSPSDSPLGLTITRLTVTLSMTATVKLHPHRFTRHPEGSNRGAWRVQQVCSAEPSVPVRSGRCRKGRVQNVELLFWKGRQLTTFPISPSFSLKKEVSLWVTDGLCAVQFEVSWVFLVLRCFWFLGVWFSCVSGSPSHFIHRHVSLHSETSQRSGGAGRTSLRWCRLCSIVMWVGVSS